MDARRIIQKICAIVNPDGGKPVGAIITMIEEKFESKNCPKDCEHRHIGECRLDTERCIRLATGDFYKARD